MIIKPLSVEKAADHADITAARVVRLVNTGATEKVTVANSAAASLTLIANTSTIIEKVRYLSSCLLLITSLARIIFSLIPRFTRPL